MTRPDFTAADVQRVLVQHHALPPALAADLSYKIADAMLEARK